MVNANHAGAPTASQRPAVGAPGLLKLFFEKCVCVCVYTYVPIFIIAVDSVTVSMLKPF